MFTRYTGLRPGHTSGPSCVRGAPPRAGSKHRWADTSDEEEGTSASHAGVVLSSKETGSRSFAVAVLAVTPVALELRPPGEPPAADGAAVRFLPRVRPHV